MSWDQDINDAVARIHAIEGLPPKVATLAALKIDRILDEQFALGVDPYGTPWQHLGEWAGGRPSHLQETGAMRAFSSVEAQGSAIVMHVPDPGGFHQTGTRYMPARKIEPERTMPPAYEVAILQACKEAGLT